MAQRVAVAGSLGGASGCTADAVLSVGREPVPAGQSGDTSSRLQTCLLAEPGRGEASGFSLLISPRPPSRTRLTPGPQGPGPAHAHVGQVGGFPLWSDCPFPPLGTRGGGPLLDSGDLGCSRIPLRGACLLHICLYSVSSRRGSRHPCYLFCSSGLALAAGALSAPASLTCLSEHLPPFWC